MKQRTEWIDYSKGIGIILVVIGHFGVVPRLLINWIYTFHMPLFFFITGYLLKGSFEGRLSKSTRSLFVRYVLYGLSFSLLFHYVLGGSLSINEELWSLFLCKFDNGNPCEIFWFLPALYFAVVFFVLTKRYFISMNWCVTFWLFLCSIGFYCSARGIILPLKIETALVGLVFLLGGYLYHNSPSLRGGNKDSGNDAFIHNSYICLLHKWQSRHGSWAVW